MSNEFIPSVYQTDIFNWFDAIDSNQANHSSVAVNAVAGSGKTTTIVKGMRRLPPAHAKDSLFAAFNKSIVGELKTRLGSNVDCQTIHALGFRALREGRPLIKNWEVDDNKYRAIVRKITIEQGDPELVRPALLNLVRMTQLSLGGTSPEALFETAQKFSIDLPIPVEDLAPQVEFMIKNGLDQSRLGKISFTDMLHAPIALNLPIHQYGLVAVDEAQDLSKVQMALVSRAVKSGGHFVGVGDPRQAIYYFAGAEPDSFYQVRDFFGASEMPLSICYRCPKSVIAVAKTIVPMIEAAETAIDGTVADISTDQFNKMLEPGDMVLCRTTAPLIKLCFALLSRRIHATVKGREIGTQLTDAVKAVSKMPGFDWPKFITYLHEWRNGKIDALMQKDGTEAAIEALKDKAECIEICYLSFRPFDVGRFCEDIEGLFSDNGSKIVLSTVHRAKGLENPRVFIIHPEKLPLTWKGQTPDQAIQEMNLRYVAVTRAQRDLYFVRT